MDISKLIKEESNKMQSFYQKTKIKSFPINQIPPKDWPDIWKKIYVKEYPRLNKINLPKDLPIINSSLSEVLLNRKSRRKFSGKKIDLETLSSLLFYSGGIIPGGKNWQLSKRFYPSAGARYPLEIYISINNVDGISNGLYHYNIKQHSLDVLSLEKNFNKQIAKYTSQDWVSKANIVIMLGAVFQRNQIKYNERGLRYIFIDAGHLGQNFYLVATALSLKICAIGGFCDDKINKIVDADGETEGVIYLFGVGK